MCGICGYIAYNTKSVPSAKQTFIRLLAESERRGEDATGIGFVETIYKKKTLCVLKKPMKATDFVEQVDVQALLKNTAPHIAIGHTRAKTHGDEQNPDNNHPIMDGKGLALVHNGIITDADEHFTARKLPRSGEVDSEIILRLISHYKHTKHLSTVRAIQETAKTLHGAMACALIDKAEPDALYVWASTSPLTLAYDKKTKNVFFASLPIIITDATMRMNTYMDIFADISDNPDILTKTVANDSGYCIKNGIFTAFPLKRPAFVSSYNPPRTQYNSYTYGSHNKNTNPYCYDCRIYHPVVKPYMCNFHQWEPITQPKKYATKQLELRINYLKGLKESLFDGETQELKRLENAYTDRIKKEQKTITKQIIHA